MKKIFVANIPFQVTEDELKLLFEVHGEIESVKIIRDKNSGRSKGYGFVEMEDDAAVQAVENLHEKEFGGRPLVVELSKT